MIVPPGRNIDGKYAMLVNIGEMMDAIENTFAVGGDSLEIKLQQLEDLPKNRNANYSKLLLGPCLTASILLGLTLYFAQFSAHRASISLIDKIEIDKLIDGAKQVAIVATDPSGLITKFNPAAE